MAFLVPFSTVPAEFAFDPMHPELFTVLTCLFLHDPENILHLLGNLVFLAAVGPMVESRVGPLKFGLIYLVSGVVGVMAHWLIAINSGVGAPLIGASSAIAGCVGYCTVRFARKAVPLAPRLSLNVGVVALIWLALQGVGAFVNFSGGSSTSYVAHIGGFLAGVGLAFVLLAQREASAEAGREVIGKMADRSPAAAIAVAQKHLSEHGEDPVALWELAAGLHQMGERDREAEVLASLVRKGHDLERALDCLIVIGRLRVLSPIERMKLSEQVAAELRCSVLKSVAAEADDEPQRAHAILALVDCVTEEERSAMLLELQVKYAFHPAAEAARVKGWIE